MSQYFIHSNRLHKCLNWETLQFYAQNELMFTMVNKILAHVIWKSFSFHFIQN